ncbi:MauE/DoxX family redox-associated membrane protein [Streptomonospora litoralis]|uniref:Methylamine utilisation protein MauE domain-containing protein n=1 Tax=Streptomonospora litoralis TaxID=2498135 RepID=A0A4P6Q768_9ACTN|nr:MauE/DoxX family redox-associated membrane protein [Streptomonospora litoralis]QBI56543.1 hypothetical protein EKD16_23985 [Streptomonospora litoralis]
MLDVVRESQLPVLAVMLLLGAAAKLADRSPRGQGPAVLLPVRWRRVATPVQGTAEAVIALALIGAAGAVGGAARIAAAVLFAGGVAALAALRRTAPETGCGCFGGLSTTPVDWRSIARSALLGAAALATVGLPTTAVGVVSGATPGHAAVIAVEALLIGALSPELVELARRATRRVPCAVREVPVKRTLSRLRASDVWRANTAVVTRAEPVDVWRQGCWRFALFTGHRNGRVVDVVFGVPLEGRHPAVRAVITAPDTGAVLSVLGGPADTGRRGGAGGSGVKVSLPSDGWQVGGTRKQGRGTAADSQVPTST